MKAVRLPDFLTREEIILASQMWKLHRFDSQNYAKRIADIIIKPNIERIDKALGQVNDPMYLAYVVEYVMGLAYNNGAENTWHQLKGEVN